MIVWLAPIAGFGAFALNEIVNPRWAFLGRVHWRGDPGGVALTFDDGPHPEYTPRVLETLDRFQAKASFFVIGRYLEKYGNLTAVASRAGHLMANHSFHHFRAMSFFSAEKIREEVVQCQEELAKWVGYRPRFYRQPAGFRNPKIFGILKEMGMSLVGWQTHALDTVSKDPRAITRRILKTFRPGGIILFHDGWDRDGEKDRSPTLEALPLILQGLKDRGLEFFTLDRLLGMSKEAQEVSSGEQGAGSGEK
jgi:peptidoglycan/xylan/chitin deacetylase (PgdA/CDA1 family)